MSPVRTGKFVVKFFRIHYRLIIMHIIIISYILNIRTAQSINTIITRM